MRPTDRSDLMLEQLFGRPPHLKVFVSSQMQGDVLARERRAAIAAITGLGFAVAWAWERDAHAGPYCAEGVCVGHASTSDGLVLILGAELTRVTELEYKAAKTQGAACYILCKDGVKRDARTETFIRRERDHAITLSFRNTNELRSHIINALYTNAVQAVRRDADRRRARPGRSAIRFRLGRGGP